MRHVPYGELGAPLPPLVLAVLGAAAATATAAALAAAALATAVAPAALLVLVALAPAALLVAASGAFWVFAASTKGDVEERNQQQVKSMYPLTQ